MAWLGPVASSLPVPRNSMKLFGVSGELEPGGMPGTLPQSTTSRWVPWKCRFWTWAMWFQLPPSPAEELQPGYTTPPQLWRGCPLVPGAWIFAPPAVSQHTCCGHSVESVAQRSTDGPQPPDTVTQYTPASPAVTGEMVRQLVV